jgi:hypothetical protein
VASSVDLLKTTGSYEKLADNFGIFEPGLDSDCADPAFLFSRQIFRLRHQPGLHLVQRGQMGKGANQELHPILHRLPVPGANCGLLAVLG